MFEGTVLHETPDGIERGSALDGESAEATTGLLRYEPELGGWTYPTDGPPHDADADRTFVPRSRTVSVGFCPSPETLGEGIECPYPAADPVLDELRWEGPEGEIRTLGDDEDTTLLSPIAFLESIEHFVCHYRDEEHLQDGHEFEYVRYIPEHRTYGGTVR